MSRTAVWRLRARSAEEVICAAATRKVGGAMPIDLARTYPLETRGGTAVGLAGRGAVTKLLSMCSSTPSRLAAGLCLAALAAVAGAAPGAPAVACPAGGDGFRSPSAVAHYVEARLAGLRGERVQEAESLRLAVILDESSAELRAAHAQSLLGLGRIDAARAEARLAVACDPS